MRVRGERNSANESSDQSKKAEGFKVIKILKFPMRDLQQYRLASQLAEGHKFVASLEALEPLLEKGDAQAHAVAGVIYEFGGEGVAVDFAKAKYCYEFAAGEVGSVGAGLGLSRLYFYGKGVDVDMEYAHTLYSALIKGVDEPLAEIGLARINLHDSWEKPDLVAAEKHLRYGMSRGYVDAFILAASLRRRQGHFVKAMALSINAKLRRFVYLIRDSEDVRLMDE